MAFSIRQFLNLSCQRSEEYRGLDCKKCLQEKPIALANCTVSVQSGTCVIEDGVFNSAVLKEGVGGFDILKVAVFKQRTLKLDRLDFNVGEPK